MMDQKKKDIIYKFNLSELKHYIHQYDQKSFISTIILGFIGVIIFYESPHFKDIFSLKANVYKIGIILSFIGLLVNIWIVFYSPISKFQLEKLINELNNIYTNHYSLDDEEYIDPNALLILDDEKYKYVNINKEKLKKMSKQKKNYQNIFNIITILFQITLIFIFLSSLLILYSRFDVLQDIRLLVFLIIIFIIFIILFFITIINNNYFQSFHV